LFARTVVRFAGSFVVLLAPTTLMGMTLPLMMKAAVAASLDPGPRISVIYATNTAGAVAGALLAGYYLIGAHGTTATFRLAALVNVLVGLFAMLLAAVLSLARTQNHAHAVSTIDARAVSEPLPRIAVAIFALSGFAALALEVVWFRILVYFVPATTYAFSTMLAAVLLGLAVGAYASMPWLRRTGRLLSGLAGLQLATALSIQLAATGIATAYRAGWHTTADTHVSVLLVFAPAFLMGMSYPIGLHVWTTSSRDSRRVLDATKTGDLNSANLLGGIAGAIAGGFVVLPVLGTRGALIALSGVYVLTYLLLRRASSVTRRTFVSVLAALLAFVLLASGVPDMLDAVSGRRYPVGEQLFWRKEGAQTTAAVRVSEDGRRVLYLDGLHQASDAPEMVKLHRLIGHLPMALHSDPQRVIVVGLGGGVTPGAVSQHPARVDLVELSPSVLEAATWFRHVNYDVINRPNVHVRIDDGRNFLLSRAGQYDVLTADLIQPEHAGAGNLYSREYFQLVHRALSRDGLALQWIGHRSELEYKLILRTFLDVFPETTLWADGQLLVGATQPLVVRRESFERKLQHAATRAALADVDLDSFEKLLRMFHAGPEELRAFAGVGQVLTDDRPLIEYFRSLPPRERQQPLDLSSLKGDVSRLLQ
jgi:spermidine synthase